MTAGPDPHEEAFPRTVAAVIVAAGRGERAGTPGPKQYHPIAGEPAIAHTIRCFADHPRIGSIVVAIHADDAPLFHDAVGPLAERVRTVVGGVTRQDSVRLALEALADAAPDAVLVHDAVRPFVSRELIDRVIAPLADGFASCPALPLVDTTKRRGADGLVAATIDRRDLFAAQTPQAGPFRPLLEAHQKARESGRSDFTDDASIAEWAGLPVKLVEGAIENVKLTWPRDIEMAELSMGGRHGFPDVRTGNGYDVHAFEAGDHVTLCGVKIAHAKGLAGHSDADVALHALTDALLATCGAGDIGTHFPPSDPQWRGAASRVFVAHAVKLVRERGGRIANADVTLICETPKIGPHRQAMTETLAAMLGVAAERVSVKATTNERLGFVGREEGIAAITTATVIYPGTVPA